MNQNNAKANGAQPNGAAPVVPVFRCLGQAVRDLSMECPIAGWESQGQPQVDMNMGVGVVPRQGAEGVWDVTLSLRLRVEADKKPQALLELAYSGAFLLQHIPPEQHDMLLHVEAASLLYPFARQLVMTLLADGGYRPPLLEPVSFMALYQSRAVPATGQGQAAS
ncbi:MAG: protein-export chaperone SecB [Alphaproteobacteria bacterium]